MISHSSRSAVDTVPFSSASAEGQNTFLVPGQHPDFKASLLEEGNCLRNSLLELVLDSCHTQELEDIMDNLRFLLFPHNIGNISMTTTMRQRDDISPVSPPDTKQYIRLIHQQQRPLCPRFIQTVICIDRSLSMLSYTDD